MQKPNKQDTINGGKETDSDLHSVQWAENQSIHFHADFMEHAGYKKGLHGDGASNSNWTAERIPRGVARSETHVAHCHAATTTVGSDGPKETPERTMGPSIREDLSTVRKDGE